MFAYDLGIWLGSKIRRTCWHPGKYWSFDTTSGRWLNENGVSYGLPLEELFQNNDWELLPPASARAQLKRNIQEKKAKMQKTCAHQWLTTGLPVTWCKKCNAEGISRNGIVELNLPEEYREKIKP